MNPPKVSIIILNYNGKNLLEKFLPSVCKLNYTNYEVIIVDNGSFDGSNELIKKGFLHKVRLIENNKNLGFCKGNNIGAKVSTGKYLWFLNTDVEVEEDALTYLVDFMELNPDVGICGPKILFYSKPDKIQSAGMNFYLKGDIGFRGVNKDKDDPEFNKNALVAYISGAALFIRKDIFNLLAGFDDEMFINVEDVDLCIRTWIIGYKVMYVHKSNVYHVGMATTAKKDENWILYYDIRNKLRMILKNFELKNLLNWLYSYIIFYTNIKDKTKRGDFMLWLLKIKAFLWNMQKLPNTLIERRKIQKMRKANDKVYLCNDYSQQSDARLYSEGKRFINKGIY